MSVLPVSVETRSTIKCCFQCGSGHESAGEIVEVGEGVTEWKAEQAVATVVQTSCFSPPLPIMVSPAQWLHRLPDNVSFEEGSLCEPLAVALAGIDRAGLRLGDPVVICGAGPIGLVSLLSARAAGAEPIVITDLFQRHACQTLNVNAEAIVIDGALLVRWRIRERGNRDNRYEDEDDEDNECDDDDISRMDTTTTTIKTMDVRMMKTTSMKTSTIKTVDIAGPSNADKDGEDDEDRYINGYDNEDGTHNEYEDGTHNEYEEDNNDGYDNGYGGDGDQENGYVDEDNEDNEDNNKDEDRQRRHSLSSE
ncbi:hypothetical protein F5878DRAFT_691011 [Lentinula raphanica]|uniref:Uncharacterized protein n=1 Tax=Lentinula raphanica TaxID=153919 RepID=A0AA38UAY9_9AGAR|nr:hypothetical protein F5878DRAFT_691011 [Lentinula raphanica]